MFFGSIVKKETNSLNLRVKRRCFFYRSTYCLHYSLNRLLLNIVLNF